MPRPAPIAPAVVGRVLCSLAVLVAAGLAGCGGGNTADGPPAADPKATDAPEATSQPPADPTAARGEPKPADSKDRPAELARATTEGWWRMVFSVNGNDAGAGFLKIGPGETGGLSVVEWRSNRVTEPAKLERSNVTTDSVAMAFRAAPPDVEEEIRFDFAGRLRDGVVRGTMEFAGSPRQNLVRLVPVDQSEVTDEAVETIQLGPSPGAEAIMGALRAARPEEALAAAATEQPTSPILYLAYDALVPQVRELSLDRAAVEALAAGFEKAAEPWGPRAVQSAKLNTAIGLLSAGRETDFARAKLAEAREADPAAAADWNEMIEMAERIARTEDARAAVAAGRVEEGLADLRTLQAEKPLDPVATYRLAEAERDHGSKETSLGLFGRLAVLPQVTDILEATGLTNEKGYVPPRAAAGELWKELRGEAQEDGFAAYLERSYGEHLLAFLSREDRSPKVPDGPRVALVELITGSSCPPCVAADVAAEAVHETFPKDRVVVLRYHMHIPAPDPLANEDTVARFDYYGPPGTPATFIDGSSPPGPIAGAYMNSAEAYGRLAGRVSAALSEPPTGRIDLTASAEGETLLVKATAATDGPAETVRLRIAVAENDLTYPAPNGILRHGMVVREMLGGAAGHAAVDGEFKFEQKVPLAELRERLTGYLDRFETIEAPQTIGREFEFGVRPLELRRLTVVAFLQDETTKRVLQTAVVPIDAEFSPPAQEKLSESAEKPAAAKPEAPSQGGPALPTPE